MVWYDFENRTALDPYTREGEPNALGYVFDKSDINFEVPLTVVMVSSGLQAQELTTDQYCQLPSFQVEDRTQVVFKSGDFTKLLNTTTPLVGPAGPAVSEAVDNGNGTVTFKLPDGSEAATVALPVSDVPGPQGNPGPKGDQGLPGVNAVPADEAVATYAQTPGSATAAALSATFARIVAPERVAPGVDASASVQAAVDKLRDAGGGVLEFPEGEWLLNGAYSAFGLEYAVGIVSSGITVRCRPGARLVRTRTTGGMFFVTGCGKNAPLSQWNLNRYTDKPVLPITGPVAKGATSITLSTPADAAQFAPGDFLYLRTGQLTSNPLTTWHEPDAETFKVISANATTGVVELNRPTGKPYAQEYYPAQTGGVSSTTVTAYPAPFGVVNVTDRTISNITFEGLQVDSLSNNRNIVSAWQVENFRMVDCGGVGNAGLQTGRDLIGCTILRSRFHGRGPTALMEYMSCAASGTSDFTDMDSVYTAEGFRHVHVHEGVVRPRVVNVSMLARTASADDAAISIRARVYDALVDSPVIGAAGYGVYVDASCVGGGTVRNVRPTKEPLTSVMTVAPQGWVVDQADAVTGVVRLSGGGTSSGPSSTHVVAAHVTHATPSRTVGWLPANAVILRLKVVVYQAFNGTPSLTVGLQSDQSRYMGSLTDLTTVGDKTVPAGIGVNQGPLIPSRQAATAFLAANGATTGKAAVIIEYALIGPSI